MFVDETLIGAIYETVADTSLWPSLIEELARRSNGIGGSLFIVGEHGMDCLATQGTLELMQDYNAEHWSAHNPRVDRLFAMKHQGFITDLDLFAAEDIAKIPIYQDFFHPRGIGWVTGTFAPLPNDGKLVLSIDRRLAAGPASREEIQQLDRLHPHLLRAAWMGATIRMEAAASTTRALDAMSVAAALIDDRARIRHANASFESLAPSLHVRANGTLASSDKRASDSLGLALSSAMAQLPRGSSIPLQPGGYAPLLLHLVPMAGRARDLFSGGAAILVATRVEPGKTIDAALLVSLFDLTPMESKVAAALADGLSPQEVAARHGKTVDTVRAQIKNILSKTGNSRQIDLVRQLTSISARAPNL